MFHHTRVHINLRAYEQNLRKIASTLPANCKICAVLKADAYGHGLDLLAPIANKVGVNAIAIVDNQEARLVRELGIDCPLIRLRPTFSDEAEEAMQWGVEELAGSLDEAKSLSQLASKRNVFIPIHIALDMGMGRFGFTVSWQKEQIARICQFPGLSVRGVLAHFPCADEPDVSISETHRRRFGRDCQEIRSLLPPGILFHIANSAAIVRMPASHLHLVRLGILSYGLPPSPFVPVPEGIEPVMSIVTRIAQIRDVPKGATIGYGMTHRLERDSRIATLPIGYANGYLRDFSNKAYVLVHGVRCPVVGRISMDIVSVDVGHVPSACPGDDAVLLGSQGNETITADELAGIAGTINYEITCLMGNINRADRFPIPSATSETL